MPIRKVDYLLIGGGLASANCARWLREEGAEGSILLVGRELDAPYNRPPCSKGYLRGEETREQTLFRPAEWWAEQEIELLTRTSVTGLDLEARAAKLSTREEVEFGEALIATGANVRRLSVEGAELEQIHYLRALGNADAIRAGARDAEDVVLIGGSYIGCEVAASLSKMGRRCTIVMQEDVTFERSFGARAGRFFQEILEAHGVRVHGADELDRVEGEGRVGKVITKGGLELPAQMVVIGAGVLPDVRLAQGAGLQIGARGGVRCDSRLQTSVPGVFAAGDICEYESPLHGGRPLRVEHWDVAFNHGKTAALNMLGRDVAHEVVPYFFSDLADWASLEYVGPAYEWDEEIVRGSYEDGAFSHWYLKEGRVAAALSVGRSEDLEHARRLIAAGAPLGEERAGLGDLGTDLEDLGR
ncbi:MAG TPA: FAD-dependent oxidoreductase [Solirubrobacteraceae bacterium]|jgi:3-phenylpropionate/trans-cinnamate dioxygenase ferredoxin reductase subunit|nr:FAD-dependent oxidoreductase [Solirubrobacteraceae bacterium]